jgi:hypothetical protein
MQLGKRPRKSEQPADSGMNFAEIEKDEVKRAEPIVKVDRSTPVEAEIVDVNRKLAGLARTVKSQQRKATEAVLAAGEALKEAQELLSDHNGGSFGKWVTEKVGISRRTAYRMISAWEAFGGCDSVTQRIDVDAVRKLAGGPERAVNKAIRLINAGENVDLHRAKELIAEAAPPATKKSREAPIMFQCEFGSVAVVAKTGIPVERVLLTVLKEIQAAKAA